jgi:L-alanine-DL-glutamate epimerase-like enolase superfamily enzyme
MTQITNVTTQLLRIPLGQRTITDSQSRVDAVEFVQVTLETNEGVTGHGMNWSYTAGLRAAQVMIDECYKSVLLGGDPLFRKELVRRMFFSNHFVGRVGAARVGIAAVEFALWDIACKLANMPLWKYLGAARDRVKAYSTDGGWLTWSTDELIADTRRLVERGFDAVKIKLGRPDPREDFERVGAVRKALGPNINIMTDVNCAWSLATARQWGTKLSELGVYWLEEPMLPEDVKSHALLQRALSIPIAVGETIYTKYAFRDYIEAGAVGIVQADATKLLGIGEWLEVAALANSYNLPIVPHTNVQQKLHVQLAAATPHAIMVENCYESLNEIWEEPIYVRDGYYNLPSEPGCGLRLREKVIQETRIG